MSPDVANHLNQKFTRLSSRHKKPFQRGSWQVSKDLPTSFRYAIKGLAYAFLTQRNFRIHLSIGLLALGLGIWLELSTSQLAILALTVAAVLVLELVNTSIEAVVDLFVGRRFHPLAGIAKDCAAGAVLVASISSLFIASLILLPAVFHRLVL